MPQRNRRYGSSHAQWATSLLLPLAACGPRGPAVADHVVREDNEHYAFTSEVRVLVESLENPGSPVPHEGRLIYAESGRGVVASVPIEGGPVVEHIRGFALDEFAGYTISVQGITIEPTTGSWIVAAADGPGRITAFDPARFPSETLGGTLIELVGAVDDNPWETVFVGDLLVASGGTSKGYAGIFDPSQPMALAPVLEVETGVIGIAADAASKVVYGAVFGAGPGTGSIVAWDTGNDYASRVVVEGLSNPVDVTVTPEGLLLIVEFGEFDTAGTGRVLVAPIAGGPAVLLLSGLNAPSGVAFADGSLYVAEFGAQPGSRSGQLLVVGLEPRAASPR